MLFIIFHFVPSIFSSKNVLEYYDDLRDQVDATIAFRQEALSKQQLQGTDPFEMGEYSERLEFSEFLGKYFLSRLRGFRYEVDKQLSLNFPVEHLIKHFFGSLSDNDEMFEYFRSVPQYSINILDDLSSAKIFQFSFLPQDERKLGQIIVSSNTFKYRLDGGLKYNRLDIANFLKCLLNLSPTELPGTSLEENAVVLERAFFTFCYEVYKEFEEKQGKRTLYKPNDDTTFFTHMFRCYFKHAPKKIQKTESTIDFYSQFDFEDFAIIEPFSYKYLRENDDQDGIEYISDIIIVKKDDSSEIIWSNLFTLRGKKYRLLGGICRSADGKLGDVQIIDWSKNCEPEEKLKTYSDDNGGTKTTGALSHGEIVGENWTCFLLENSFSRIDRWYNSEVEKALKLEGSDCDSAGRN